MSKHTSFQKIISILILINLIGALTGCGGTKVLKKPQAYEVKKPLAEASDQNISTTLIWVIVRDGPGTWAKNADWDEYLVNVVNESDELIQIIDVIIVDSLGVRQANNADYNALVDESYETTKRYKDSNIEVKSGIGIGTILAVAGASLVGAGALATAAAPAALMAGGAAVIGGAAAIGAIVVLVPSVIGIGTVRYINRKKVSKEIEKRHTVLPVIIKSHENLILDIFFPLAPSPTKLEITYMISGIKETLAINTSKALKNLHLVQ